jgi:hypothetical protein
VLDYINLMMFFPVDRAIHDRPIRKSVCGSGQGFYGNVDHGVGATFPTMVRFLAARLGLV